MKVLHLLNYGWPRIDGYTVRSAGLVTAQAEVLGWDTHVATGPHPAFTAARDPEFQTSAWGPDQPHLGRTRSWERPGMGVAPVSARTTARDLDVLVEALTPDVVHVHHPHYLAGPARRVTRRRNLPMVYEVRCFNGDYDLDRRHPWYRVVRGPRFNQAEMARCRAADAVVTISDGLADRIRAGGVGRVHVVRNSIDAATFRPPAEARRRRPDHAVTVGYATTFEPIESLPDLVEGLDRARRALAEEVDLRAVIAGTGRVWDDIEDLRRTMDAEGWLSLPGFVPYHRMPQLLGELDLFVVPRSQASVVQHTTPLKPLEALACGTPVLATDLPALHELLGGHPQVRFCPTGAAGIAEGIIDAVRDGLEPADPGVLDRSWTTEVERYVAVYEAAGVRQLAVS